jgi:hypothetical protein
MLLLRRASARTRCRGSALLLAFLVLILLAAILFQLYIGTTTDARVARNEVNLTAMNQAIESALIKVYDELIQDAEAGEASSAAGSGSEPQTDSGGFGGDDMAPPAPPAPPAGAGGESQSVDSHEDSWGRAQRTTINEVELRIVIQDEDSKLNLLTLLTEDEDEAEKALERVVRVLDLCREDTSADLDRSDARRLAEAMLGHMKQRATSPLPSATRLSLLDEDIERELPFTLREMVVLEPFDAGLFRDFRDERGRIVHSIGSFLTVWTSLKPLSDIPPPPGSPAAEANEQSQSGNQQGGNEPQQQGDDGQGGAGEQGEGEAPPAGGASGGIAVNINTAPAAVLKSLMDDRDVDYRFWDEVIEYRNLEEESEGDEEEAEPIYDEFGQEILPRKVFDSLAELEELRSWDRVQAEQRAELSRLIGTQSQVFSIFISARRATGRGDAFGGVRGSPLASEREDQRGDAIVTTVRSVVWRYQDGSEWKVVPLVRWEVLDYTPFEVLDFPPDDR